MLKRLAAFLMALSLLAALAIPAIEPTYSALAQDGSAVSGQEGEEPSEAPTEVPTDIPPPPTDVPTDVPPPTEVPPTDVPPTEVPPPPTDTSVPSVTPSSTDVPVIPAADTATSSPSITATTAPVFQVGDLVSAKVNVNCRETAVSGLSVRVIMKTVQAYVIEAPVNYGSDGDWIKVQIADATTLQCYTATRYFNLVSSGNAIPGTITPTPTVTLTRGAMLGAAIGTLVMPGVGTGAGASIGDAIGDTLKGLFGK